jgi:hypothetical protein
MGDVSPASEVSQRHRPSIAHFLAGFFIALVLDAVLTIAAFFFPAGRFMTVNPLFIAVSWLVTVVVFVFLYRQHAWMAYGALGAYAVLLFFTLAGGATAGTPFLLPYGYPAQQ